MKSKYKRDKNPKFIKAFKVIINEGLIKFIILFYYSIKSFIKNNIFKKHLIYWYFKLFKKGRNFIYKEDLHDYFYHKHNTTYLNERTVEISIMKKIIERNCKDKKIFELGNVLQYYFPCEHDILDKYENKKNVITKDIMEFNPEIKYDLIVSVSTIEHIGVDDESNNPRKVLEAIDKLKEITKLGGKIIFTVPMGYNPYLDNFIKDGLIDFEKFSLFRRVSSDNLWKEELSYDIKKIDFKYGFPYEAANWLIIGEIRNNKVY